MMGISRVSIAAVLAALTACGSQPTVVEERSIDFHVPEGTSIYLIPVKLTYEDIKTRKSLPAGKFQGAAVAAKIEHFAASSFKKKHFPIVGHDTPEAADKALSERANHLFRHKVDKKTQNHIDSVCRDKINTAVLAHYMRIKVGTDGWWNPYSGAIAPSNSNSYLQAAVLDCRTKNVLWRNGVFFRAVPAVDAAASANGENDSAGDAAVFKEALTNLYETVQ